LEAEAGSAEGQPARNTLVAGALCLIFYLF
jgi:hypothetical protein